MKSLQDILTERVLVFDGAMGTNIQRFSLSPDDFRGNPGLNEILNISRPDVIAKIHEEFLSAGCDVIETNTFGANGVVFEEYGEKSRVYEINFKAAELSKQVARDFSSGEKPRFVAGSIGPGTKLVSLGQISIEEIREAYAPQIHGLIDGGVDLFILETNQDLLHLKTLLILLFEILEQKKQVIPVIAQVTMETNGKMLLGTDLQAVIVSLSHFPLFALGINCSTGPEPMYGYVKTLSEWWERHISVMPNAGMPRLAGNKTYYDLPPSQFAAHLQDFVQEFGVDIVGGCCGTNSEHIRKLVEAVEGLSPQKRNTKKVYAAASLYGITPFRTEPRPLIIGERCNATGSKKFREALLAGDLTEMLSVAKEQVQEGAHLLDISVAYSGIDEKNVMAQLVSRLNSEIAIPISIDSTQPEALEEALKRLAGKALVNSVNLEKEEKLRQILNLCKKYGAAVVALTIDGEGMAQTAKRKVEIAERLIAIIHDEFGLPLQDIFIDTLTFTLASGAEETANAAIETLEAIRILKNRYPDVNTILGVSNISYGLKPQIRKKLNSLFLFHALEAGLDAAILHVGKIVPLHQISEEEKALFEDLIFNKKSDGQSPLERILEYYQDSRLQRAAETSAKEISPEESIRMKIINGESDSIDTVLGQLLKDKSATEIINSILLPAMKKVGDMFGAGEMQLPFVLKSAEVMKRCIGFLNPFLEKKSLSTKGTIVLATVAGDVHDIGKNLVDIILSNNGYKVVNLGVKQPIEAILQAARQENADAIGMSGLLVSSTLVMRDNLQEMKKLGINLPVLLGGAALNEKFVYKELRDIYGENVFYAKDAFDGLKIMENLGSAKPGHLAGVNSKVKAQKSVRSKKDASERIISKDQPPTPPFWGKKKVKKVDLDSVLPFLNKKALFRSRWQLGSDENKIEFAEKKLDQLVALVNSEELLDLSFIYGYFKCFSDGDCLKIFSSEELEQPDLEVNFPRQKKPDGLCLADFFLKKDEGIFDVAIFQIVTIGKKASDRAAELFRQNQYQDYLFWHGFSVELAEALAEYVHRQIRLELNFKNERELSMNQILKGKYQGARFSPGYSAWPDLGDQRLIFKLLTPEEIGVFLTENFQLVPEQSTSALIVHHPDVKYFNV